MIDVTPLTAEQFATWSDEADERRWVELVAGKIVRLEPPDATHGLVVLNLSKALSRYVHERGDEIDGYACFELGLIIARDPDTVRSPAISYFAGGPRFAELDKIVTETRPQLVVEVVSTADRRRNIASRVESYIRWGVRQVWVTDPVEREVHSFQQGSAGRKFRASQTLEGGPVLPGFRAAVQELFHDPMQ